MCLLMDNKKVYIELHMRVKSQRIPIVLKMLLSPLNYLPWYLWEGNFFSTMHILRQLCKMFSVLVHPLERICANKTFWPVEGQMDERTRWFLYNPLKPLFARYKYKINLTIHPHNLPRLCVSYMAAVLDLYLTQQLLYFLHVPLVLPVTYGNNKTLML